MDADVFVPFLFFGFLAAIILVPIYLRERTRQSAHHLIAQALEKGQPLDPALMRSPDRGSEEAPGQGPFEPRQRHRAAGAGAVVSSAAATSSARFRARGGLLRHDGPGRHSGRPGHRLYPARHRGLCDKEEGRLSGNQWRLGGSSIWLRPRKLR